MANRAQHREPWPAGAFGLIWLLLLLLASGCSVNMAAVRTFSAETRQLTQAVDVQVSDLDASCRRRVDRLELVRPPTPETVVRYRQTCDQLATASEIPRRYNTILAEYGKALGALADDQAATFTAELGEARDSVASLANAAGASGVGPGEIAAGTRVADLIAKVASSGARKRAVMEMLQRRDDVAALCAVLKRYLDPRYVGVLDNEAGALDGLTTDLERKYGDHEPIRTRELAREFEAAKGSLQAKRAGAEQTVEALDALVVSHGKLADGARHLDRDDVVESVHSYGKEVRDVFKQLRSAYAGIP